MSLTRKRHIVCFLLIPAMVFYACNNKSNDKRHSEEKEQANLTKEIDRLTYQTQKYIKEGRWDWAVEHLAGAENISNQTEVRKLLISALFKWKNWLYKTGNHYMALEVLRIIYSLQASKDNEKTQKNISKLRQELSALSSCQCSGERRNANLKAIDYYEIGDYYSAADIIEYYNDEKICREDALFLSHIYSEMGDETAANVIRSKVLHSIEKKHTIEIATQKRYRPNHPGRNRSLVNLVTTESGKLLSILKTSGTILRQVDATKENRDTFRRGFVYISNGLLSYDAINNMRLKIDPICGISEKIKSNVRRFDYTNVGGVRDIGYNATRAIIYTGRFGRYRCDPADNKLWIWDLEKNRILSSLGGKKTHLDFRFSSDDKYIIVIKSQQGSRRKNDGINVIYNCGESRVVMIVSASSGKILKRIEIEKIFPDLKNRWSSALDALYHRNQIAINAGKMIYILNYEKGVVEHVFRGPYGYSIVETGYLLSERYFRCVYDKYKKSSITWDLSKGEIVREYTYRYELNETGILHVILNSGIILIASGDIARSTSDLYKYDYNKNSISTLLSRQGTTDYVLNEEKNNVLVKNHLGFVFIIDISRKKILSRLEKAGIIGIGKDYLSNYKAVVSSNVGVEVWDVATKKMNHSYKIGHIKSSLLAGKTLILQEENKIHILNITSSKELCAPIEFAYGITCMEMHEDKKVVAVGTLDGVLSVYSIPTGKVIARIDDMKSPVQMVKFSPNGRNMAYVRADNTITVLDTVDGRKWNVESQEKEKVHSFQFVNSKIVAFTQDKYIKFWEIEKQALVATLAHLGKKDWIVFTPDGYVDSSKQGQNFVLWKADGNLYPFGLGSVKYKIPHLLKRILNGDEAYKLKKLRKLASQ